MSKMISAGKTPKIKVDTVGGDLSVVGWDGDILVKGDEDEIRIQQNGEVVTLSCGGDLALRVPKGASFEFGNIGGDASIRGVLGDVFLRNVGGDLSIRDAGSVTIDSIGADFSLRSAHGDLHVKNAGGDVSIRDAEGKVILDSVGNDLALRGARGDVKVNVGEDVIVYLDPRADGEYAVVAGDDILLVIPPDADATLTMQGDQIEVDLPGVEPDEDATERVVVLGTGSARISLSAGGDVRVSSREDAAEYAEEFGNFAGMNFDFSGLGDRISKRVEEATRRATKRAEEAMRRAERHAERHARRGRVGMSWTWDLKGGPKPPTPPAPPSEPVTDAERMAILKMLAEKKITAEQAEQLLAALEGGK
ncbi:MAG: SHOCT-like domain-containing protein [Chloroflexota bacterium]